MKVPVSPARLAREEPPGDQGSSSDAALIRLLRAGDQEALAALFARHRAAATRLARQLVDQASADDVVSEAFLKVAAAIRRGGGPDEAFRPYLLQAVRRGAIDLYRGRREVAVDPTDNTGSVGSEASDDPTQRVADGLLIRQAFSSLPERWQAVLWLTEVEGSDRNSVGSELGINASAVSSLALRARTGLRKAYIETYAAQTDAPECRRVAGHIPAVVMRTATPAGRRAVNEHASDCERCRTILSEFRSLSRGLGAVIATAWLGSEGARYLAEGGAGALSGARLPQPPLVIASVGVAAGVAILIAALAAPHPAGGTGGVALGPPPPARTPGLAGTPQPSELPSTGAPSTPSRGPTPSPSRTNAGGPAPTAVRPTPRAGHTRTPRSTPTASPTSPPSTLAVGPVTMYRFGTVTRRLHVSVPVTAPVGAPLSMRLAFGGDVQLEVHTDRPFAPWSCRPVAGAAEAAYDCDLDQGWTVDTLGVDLTYPGSSEVRLRATSRSASGPSAEVAVELPDLSVR
jgi:RNA polymerase sigma factor (sigma-70 family)